MINCEYLPNDINLNILRAKFLRTIKLLDIEDSELTVVFERNKQMRALNKEFRNINKPTDVLSFESDFVNPETGKKVLGDIIVSTEEAISQANFAGHSIDYEILILVIHGILHLLKYDHINTNDEKIMLAKQREVLLAVIG